MSTEPKFMRVFENHSLRALSELFDVEMTLTIRTGSQKTGTIELRSRKCIQLLNSINNNITASIPTF